MASDTSFTVAGRSFRLRFSQNAISLLEERLGYSLLSNKPRELGFRDIHALFWAGLEGARLKYRDRRQPCTFEEVGELIDELGGAAAIFAKVWPAWHGAQAPARDETAQAPAAGEDAAAPDPTNPSQG